MSNQTAALIHLLNNVSYQVNRYFALAIFIFGIIGNLLNCLVLSRNPLRKNPCAFLFLTASVASLVSILSGLTTRMMAGWAADLTTTVEWLCKLRAFVLFTARTVALWSIALASIDRWCSSSTDPNRRKRSDLKKTYRNLVFVLLASILVYTHVFICYQANLTNSPLRCYGGNIPCRIVTDLTYAILSIEAPIVVMIVFGLMTIVNVRRSYHRVFIATHSQTETSRPKSNSKWKKTDSNLLLMLLIQTILFSLFTLPQAIQRMYSTFTEQQPRSLLQTAIENMIFNLLLLFTYFSNGIPFYVFTLCGNTIFRRTLFEILRRPCRDHA